MPRLMDMSRVYVVVVMVLLLARAGWCQDGVRVVLVADRTTVSVEHPTVQLTLMVATDSPPGDPTNFGPGVILLGSVQTNIGTGVATFAPANENSAVSPFGDMTQETVLNRPDLVAINNIGVTRVATPGDPPPASGPAPYGANALVPVYSCSLTFSDFTTRNVSLTASAAVVRLTGWTYHAPSASWRPAFGSEQEFDTGQLTLEVRSAPVITGQPGAQPVAAGQPASFGVRVGGGVTPVTFQWRRNGAALTDGGRVWGATTDRLVLLEVTPDDLGSYDVVVSNAVGKQTSDAAALEISAWKPPYARIGNPGNEADILRDESGPYGSVAYEYDISVHELTWFEYAQCLNAVARVSDPFEMYYPDMERGILRTQVNGEFVYTLVPGMEQRPATVISFHSAGRYCNWLHNGRPEGVQNATTTESGVYTFLSQGVIAPGSVDGRARNVGWAWAIANEDEWYKAAYSSPTNVYTVYATASDTPPESALPPGPPNAANYGGILQTTTRVGAYMHSPSAFGTYDQSGNVSELVEGRPDNNGFYVRTRGGDFQQGRNSLASGRRSVLNNSPWYSVTHGVRLVRSVSDATVGACCLGTPGECVDGVTEAACVAMGGSYAGDGTACVSQACSIPRGACCLTDGTCVEAVTAAECDAVDGLYQGNGVSCLLAACNPIGPVAYINAAAPSGGDGTSWAQAFNDPQDAIALHERYPELLQELWFAAGTYKPDSGTGSRRMTFEFGGLRVYGGFAGNETSIEQRDPVKNLTVLSGDLLGNDQPGFVNYEDNSLRVVTVVASGGTPVLDGFTVRGGRADEPVNGTNNGAGAFYNTDGAVIRDCVFIHNWANTVAGGLNCSDGKALVIDCRFVENRGGSDGSALRVFRDTVVDSCVFDRNPGMSVSAVQRGTFIDCTFTGNGGGVVLPSDTTGTFVRCSFSGHTDYCVEKTGSGAVIVAQECVFEGNTGGVLRGADMSVTDCVFRNNSRAEGGAVLITDFGDATFTRSLFEGNAATTDAGGAIRSDSCDLVFDACVFTGNSAATSGGAMDVGSMASLDLSGTTFAGNSAPRGNAVRCTLVEVVAGGTFAPGDELYNEGTVSPGGRGVVGTFEAAGGYESFNRATPGFSTGNYVVDIGGTGDGEYDVIDCHGAPAVLGGGILEVNFMPGFTPTAGDTFRVIRSGSVSGSFDAISAPALAEGQVFDIEYTSEGVEITLTTFDSMFAFGDEQVSELDTMPSDLAMGDLDADGFLDLVIVYPGEPNGTLAVYRSAGVVGGVWQGFHEPALYEIGSDPRDVAIGRFSDGPSLDVAAACAEDGVVHVFFNTGDAVASLEPAAQIALAFPVSVAVGLGTPADLYIGASVLNTPVRRYRSDGKGGFQAGPSVNNGGQLPVAIAAQDLDGDGHEDLIMLRWTNLQFDASSVATARYNPATASYAQPAFRPVGRGARNMVVGDIDGDGRNDILVTNTLSGTMSVFTADPAAPAYIVGHRTLVVGVDVGSITLGDFNADARLDVALIADDLAGQPKVRLLRNDTLPGGDPLFHTGVDIGFSGVPRLLVTGDVDGGGPDLHVIRTGPRGGGALLSTKVNSFRPACAADWDTDGALNSQDFFEFLTDFFAVDADFNRDGATDSQDFFEFLRAFFEGC